jgi:diguanylate cyclase (GGDEF)-like protein/PAS domain S-box-containing protein
MGQSGEDSRRGYPEAGASVLPRGAEWALLPAPYVVAGKLGLMLAFVNPSASAVWPATGVALAGMLVFGRRVWPLILAGAFAVNFATAGSLATSLGIAVGNTLEAVVGAGLVTRWAEGTGAFERPRNVFRFALIAAFASAPVSATIGVTSLVLGGLAEIEDVPAILGTWWLGGLGGALVVAPPLVLWAIGPARTLPRYRSLELGAAAATTLLTGAAIFGGLLPVRGYPVSFLALPPLLWIGLRFTPREAASANALLSAVAVLGAMRGFGPFIRPSPNETLLLLQAFMATISMTTLAVAAAASQRRRAEAQAARLAAIVASSDDAIVGQDLDGRIVSWNQGAERLYGYPAAEAIGRHVSMLTPTGGADRLPRVLDEIRSGGRVAHYETLRVRRDGRRIAVSLSVSPVIDARGEVVGTSAIARDVSEASLARERLCASEARYRLLFERNLAGVYRATPEGRLVDCNDAFARLLGYETRVEALAGGWDELAGDLGRRLVSELRRCGSLRNLELRLQRRDGSLCWALCNHALLTDADGTEHLEGSLVDVTERKRIQDQIEFRALHDPLTSLANRAFLSERLRVEIAQARRTGHRLALMFLDLDDFKAVNDTLGHASGDVVLQQAAARLRDSVRQADCVARVGGDEFVVLLPFVQAGSDAAGVARELIRVLDQPFLLDGREIRLGASIGIAVFPEHGEDGDALVRNADAAMYAAKQAGRGRYCFCAGAPGATTRGQANERPADPRGSDP